ncbi:hypothetical protein K503DRAFT_728329 [Rhizopogon vinicolor AM-OR11-026]|uniref:Uncharacterized protein n=1 Tax=Rhizopogon vinicolor AM-OR11-026 TaxID=1314800 RepID=A0A1B7NIP7_9AGAM|nr:hypothetical protein K503DRAFT_728329 [Rhizopogon vinicolor AM-OR11-026]
MSLSTSIPKPSIPSASDSSSLAASSRSHALTVPSATRTVVTAPPWAQDEPPSPSDQPDDEDQHPYDHRPSETASRSSFGGVNGTLSERQPHWWTFARPQEAHLYGEPSSQTADRNAVAHRNRPTLSLSIYRPSHDEPDCSLVSPLEKGTANSDSGAHPSSSMPFTLSHNKTPGWDTPWKPKTEFPMDSRGDYSHLGLTGDRTDGESGHGSDRSRKKRFRAFILTNIYVPLLFRFTNITFTTAALAIAIRIRILELHYGIMGIVGSSPTLVIIFAPLTLVHVMVAIYLEYFGRPLGLWQTSGKLAHTLLEVCFICAWSAAFSLCFDNYFTSRVPCASASRIAWYNELPRPELSLADLGEGGVGDTICDYQLALICLVGVGLVLYCISLVISLFRIFEKVKSYAGSRRTEHTA